jgi:mono/diheme cytochrome c family protein
MSGKVLTAVLIAVVLLCAGLAVGAGQAQGADPKAKALFESKCSVCHSLSRPLGENKDLAGWTKTVTRMQKVNGCPITDQEAKTIIDYLVAVRGPSGK